MIPLFWSSTTQAAVRTRSEVQKGRRTSTSRNRDQRFPEVAMRKAIG